MSALRDVLRTYRGSDAERSKALYARLDALGPIGAVAVNLLRAQKASERAKQYRGRYNKVAAYNRKEWALDQLRIALAAYNDSVSGEAPLGASPVRSAPSPTVIAWGWGLDAKQRYYPHVLYVEIPTGQVSFHAAVRGGGPDYPRGWDGVRGTSADRIIRWAARLLEGRDERAAPPALPARAIADRPKAGEQLRLL